MAKSAFRPKKLVEKCMNCDDKILKHDNVFFLENILSRIISFINDLVSIEYCLGRPCQPSKEAGDATKLRLKLATFPFNPLPAKIGDVASSYINSELQYNHNHDTIIFFSPEILM